MYNRRTLVITAVWLTTPWGVPRSTWKYLVVQAPLSSFRRHGSRFVDSYNMTWKVMSYPPLQEVRLLYRKLLMNDTFQQPGRWHDVILTPTPRSSPEPSEHIMSFHLRGLQPSSVYEGIVQAKNRYGWNEVSDIFQFYTQRSSSEPRLEDMELVASSTSRSRGSSTVTKRTLNSCQHFLVG
uniref:Fibronectin type-III domain-containing protein n=1 Tax=Lutzomyia longipalpis TaxID=7200 RepID=A0A1B0CRM2_LUTLO